MVQPINNQRFTRGVVSSALPFDPYAELPPWNQQIAEEIAKEEGIELTPAHWEVIHFLRRRYVQQGQVTAARELTLELEEQVAGERGGRYLYQLFPRGPVTQGCRIAGLPAPAYHADPSFGSVQ